ncbi:MAG: hypothetical protein ACOYVK_08130 [Bacillota bacterium]
MGTRMVSLSIAPREVLERLMSEIEGDVIHHELHALADQREFGSIVLNRYTSRPKGLSILIVNVNNIRGGTSAVIITECCGKEWLNDDEWEEEEGIFDEMMDILDAYILDICEI